MPDLVSSEVDPPRPGRVGTRQDFARELTLLREQAGLTVRQVASKVGVQGAHSTIGDWFAGRGLPSMASRDLLMQVLAVCGARDGELVEQWLQAWRRVRRAPGHKAGRPEPYRGLASFQLEDAGWFFGRQALSGQLLARLADLHAAGGGVQVVVGASGSGKSSLLRAGLIPALHAGRVVGSQRWPVVLFTPGSRPVDELAATLAALTGVPADEMADVVRAGPGRCAGYARQAAIAAAGQGVGGGVSPVDTKDGGVARPAESHQLVLVIDQFEEVFTARADEEEQRLFIAALCAAAGPGGALVVLGLRADFYAQALQYPQLVAAVQASQVVVGPMNEAELREAIVAPARKAKLDIEDGLVDLLLREVAPQGGSRAGQGAHDAGVLPLLSHALYATWHRGQGRRLTIAAYREVGGIDGAVAASASKVFDELTEQQQQLARRLFLSLVHVAADTADTRRRVTTTELLAEHGDTQAAEMDDVLDRFVAQRLITADTTTVEISHEALLNAWPQLRNWLDTDRAGLIIGRRLAEAAATWCREHRDPAALYGGTRLAAAQEWAEAAGPRADLTPLAREFLDASIHRELSEQDAARRRTRRLRQLVAGLVVLLLLTAAAAGAAVHNQQVIQEQRNIAVSGKVANEATALRTTNPALAAQLSLAAYRLAPIPEARGSLLSTFATPYATRLTDHTSAVYAAVFSPDRRTLATASIDHTARLWDVTDPHRPSAIATLIDHTNGVFSAVFSPDGRTLATASIDHTARLWDVTDPHRPSAIATLIGHTDAIRRLAFSPDGHTLATASYDKTARLWDVTDPHRPSELATLTGHTKGLAAAVFGSEGHTLATVGSDQPVRLWDITDRRHPTPLPHLIGHTDRVLSATFSPDGRILATGSFDNTVRLWDITAPHHPGPLATLTGHIGGIVAIAFSPDGHTLATGSYDLTARLWDITDPPNIRTSATLKGHADTIYTVDFSPDGNTLATGSRDNTARLWDIHGPVLTGPSNWIGPVAFSPDGHILAAGSYLTAHLWDVTDPDHPSLLVTLTGHTDGVSSVAFSPDRQTLATASLDFTVRLWDLTDLHHPTRLATLTDHTDNVFTVAFSPDRHTLATAGADRTTRLWDVTDPSNPHAIATLPAHADRVNSVAFSPDGHTLATSSADLTTRLWDITDPGHPRPTATLRGHSNNVLTVAFSLDGHTLGTGSADHTARLWDITDLHHPALLTTLTGHSNSVGSVAFSPDGHTLLTGGYDNTARLWDITDLRHPGSPTTLTGHSDAVNSVAFSPDRRTVITGSDDATVRLWDTDTDRVAKQVCTFAFPLITRAEWSQYFADLAYQPPCQ